MKALVLAEKADALPELRGLLEGSAHKVTTVTTARAALAEIGAKPPDITIVSWQPLSDALPPIVAAVRACEDATCHFVIAVLNDDSPVHRMAAYEAGADEVVRTTAPSGELLGILRSAERIIRLEHRLHARVVDLESALRRLELAAVRRGQALAAVLPASGAAGSFLMSRAWTKVEEVLTVMCNDYMQGGFTLVARADTPPPKTQGASITLTDVEHELTVELFFCASQASSRAIATAFCGDASMVDDDMVRDVLLELANSGMGAVKAAFSAEKFSFTGAVPKALTLESPTQWLEEADAKRVLAFHSETATLYALVGVRRAVRVKVATTALREGMVLAEDVLNDAGLLIARAGTRLTETAADRIARLVPKQQVELSNAS